MNRNRLVLLGAIASVLTFAAVSTPAATPKEAVGFRGTVSGTVKSAQPDGKSFVLTVSRAEPEKISTVKDTGPMIGKNLTLGVRMVRQKDGKTTAPSPEDIAYIKTLKPGMTIEVKVFSVHSDPTVQRIQGPGHSTTQPAEKGK